MEEKQARVASVINSFREAIKEIDPEISYYLILDKADGGHVHHSNRNEIIATGIYFNALLDKVCGKITDHITQKSASNLLKGIIENAHR
jgi:hypothetical protein